jgi:hypothetical protein
MSVYDFPWNSDVSAIGIYNTLCTTYTPGMSTGDLMGVNNQAALQNAVTTAIQNGGGLIVIPTGTYLIKGAVLVQPSGTLQSGVIIAGTSGGAQLVQQESGNTFTVSGMTTGNAIRFRDLNIQYSTSTHLTGTGIAVSNCDNVTCERVFFTNCPTSVSYDSSSSQCGLFNCTIDYQNGKNLRIMVSMMGTDNYVDNCVFRQSTGNTPSGCTGIYMTSATSCFVTNTHISDFDKGINIDGASTQLRFSNVVSPSWTTSLTIQPISSGTITQSFFDNCIFYRSGASQTTTPGIYIDTNSTGNSPVSDIYFADCMSYSWGGAGLQINKGRNIQINGGRFGANASGTTGAGISITSTAANVLIGGADCSGTVVGQPNTQPYGISVTANVAGVYVSNCNLTGNSNSPGIYINATSPQLEVTECAGYNDLGTPLSATPPLNSTFQNTTLGWYGPVGLYVSGGSVTISINGQPTGLTGGGFTLAPGGTAEISGSGSPSRVAVGK